MSRKRTNDAVSDEPRESGPTPPEAEAAGEYTEPGAAAGVQGAENPAERGAEIRSIEELKRQLEEARATADAHWETVLRTRAELDNVRKRSARDLENAHKFGVDRFVAEILPVKDSLELGLAAASGNEASLEKVREGMELTLKMFSAALSKLGVAEVNPEGEGFNPEYHQAMTMQDSDGHQSGSVVSVVQKGYLLNERLVRPALVVVAK